MTSTLIKIANGELILGGRGRSEDQPTRARVRAIRPLDKEKKKNKTSQVRVGAMLGYAIPVVTSGGKIQPTSFKACVGAALGAMAAAMAPKVI